jgi:uncharacterized protein DUF4190
MKYCPNCNRQYSETWLTFCSEDGTMLIEDLTPAADPDRDPVIREPVVQDRSEQETQWLPRQTPAAGGWIAPDERAPMAPAWRPPPPPAQPIRQQSQGLALGSMITGLLGLVIGCFGPAPGIAAIILGGIALSKIKSSPETYTGKPLAIIGIVTGAVTVVLYSLIIIWWLVMVGFAIGNS